MEKKYYFTIKEKVFDIAQQFDYDRIEIINLENKTEHEVENIIKTLDSDEIIVEENCDNLILAIYYLNTYTHIS